MSAPTPDAVRSSNRLLAVDLDAASIGGGSVEQDSERRAAIADLLVDNSFALAGHDRGPYALRIGLHGAQLALDVRTAAGEPVVVHLLSLKPFRSLLRDYMMLCESHVAAIRNATPAQIEVIDMGRRGLHNEAADRLAERLAGKITADFDTLRRLFTLLTALHWKG